MISQPSSAAALRPTSPPANPRLGEELPIFCEHCGYQLFGLPQVRCDHCQVLHFRCPECGRRQPINTLRPAAQRILGRLRALGLAASVFVKLNFFGWILLGFLALGYDISVQGYWNPNQAQPMSALDLDTGIIVVFWTFLFGAAGRMLLLRWQSGALIGVILGGVAVAVLCLGALWRMRTLDFAVSAFGDGFLMLIGVTFMGILLGAMAAWPTWSAAAMLFLPRKIAIALLDWQHSLSGGESALADRAGADLATGRSDP